MFTIVYCYKININTTVIIYIDFAKNIYLYSSIWMYSAYTIIYSKIIRNANDLKKYYLERLSLPEINLKPG